MRVYSGSGLGHSHTPFAMEIQSDMSLLLVLLWPFHFTYKDFRNCLFMTCWPKRSFIAHYNQRLLHCIQNLHQLISNSDTKVFIILFLTCPSCIWIFPFHVSAYSLGMWKYYFNYNSKSSLRFIIWYLPLHNHLWNHDKSYNTYVS